MKYMTSRALSSRGGLLDISLIILHDDTNADRYAVRVFQKNTTTTKF